MLLPLWLNYHVSFACLTLHDCLCYRTLCTVQWDHYLATSGEGQCPLPNCLWRRTLSAPVCHYIKESVHYPDVAVSGEGKCPVPGTLVDGQCLLPVSLWWKTVSTTCCDCLMKDSVHYLTVEVSDGRTISTSRLWLFLVKDVSITWLWLFLVKDNVHHPAVAVSCNGPGWPWGILRRTLSTSWLSLVKDSVNHLAFPSEECLLPICPKWRKVFTTCCFCKGQLLNPFCLWLKTVSVQYHSICLCWRKVSITCMEVSGWRSLSTSCRSLVKDSVQHLLWLSLCVHYLSVAVSGEWQCSLPGSLVQYLMKDIVTTWLWLSLVKDIVPYPAASGEG